ADGPATTAGPATADAPPTPTARRDGPDTGPVAAPTGPDGQAGDPALTVSIPVTDPVPVPAAGQAPVTAVPAGQAAAATAVPATVLPTTAPVATPTAGAAPLPGSPAALAEQVLTRVSSLRQGPDGTHHLTMRLDPGHLGPLTVVAEVRNGAIRLELTAVMPAAQEALRHAAADLRRDLADAGFGSAAVDVRSDGSGAGEPRGGLGDRSDRGSAQGNAGYADSGSGGPEYEPRGDRAADRQAIRTGTGGHRAVDVRV
ncbi:MAG: Collagen alpha-2(I) chain, partial [Mycobacterium sp.]|nr:Collagen alpha-2(I) chain [Mycobacterium sp.]